MREMTDGRIHTYQELDEFRKPILCPACSGQSRLAVTCVQVAYSARFRHFMLAHRAVYQAQAFDGDARAARAETERLRREFLTLPPGHSCTCRCPFEHDGCPVCQSNRGRKRGQHDCSGPPRPPCLECQRLRKERDRPCPKHGLSNLFPDCPDCTHEDVGVEIGRHGGPAHAPAPVDVAILDIMRLDSAA